MNLVVICVDTYRADMVGEGKKLSHVKTPHLDALAAESVVFDRCFAEGLPTIPLRRCVFTGKRSFPWRFETPNEGLQPAGSGWHPIPHELDTLAERLHDGGYATGLVADTYHMFKATMNFTRGFLSWRFIRGQENDGYRLGPLSRIDLAAHTPEGEADPARHPVIAQYLLNVLDRQEGEEHYLAAQVFRTASQWVQDNAENAPFFLWIDSFSPHELWDTPRHYADAYFSDPSVKDYIYPQVINGKNPSEAEVERTRALYMGYATFVDRWIGHFLESLESLGLMDDTVVMFLSDHGTQLWDKGKFGKGADELYPFNTQLNWFIRHPDGPRGQHVDAWVQNQDVTVTALNLMGIDHSGLDGLDAWAIAMRKSAPVRDHITTGWGPNMNVRDEEYSVHFNVTEATPTPTVFDLVTDPDENSPLAEPPSGVAAQALARAEGGGGRPAGEVYLLQTAPPGALDAHVCAHAEGVEVDFTLNSDHEAIREMTSTFCRREILPHVRDWDRAHRFPREILPGMAETGLLGVCIPRRYGGLGRDYLSLGIVSEELERADSSFRVLIAVHLALNSLALFQWGNEAQKQRYLVPQARGEKVAAFALTEPGASSDAASIITTARREGDAYVLNGEKTWIGLADLADHFLLFAKTDPPAGHRGISAFVVERGFGGVKTSSIQHKLGVRIGNVGSIVLQDVRVPAENRIGEEGEGFKIAMSALDNGRYTVAAGAVGLIEACLEASLDYAKTRETFGQPIARHQLVQQKIAAMVAGRDIARLLYYRVGWMKNEGMRCTREVSLAKWQNCRCAFQAAHDAVQIHGANGYGDEYPVERYFRNSRGATIYEGTEEIHQLVQAEYELGYRIDRPLSRPLPPYPFEEDA